MDKVSEAIVVRQDENGLYVVLFEKGETDWGNSVNAQLIVKGLARMQSLGDDEDVPEEVNDWYSWEEEARDNQVKIWQYGGAADDSDYE